MHLAEPLLISAFGRLNSFSWTRLIFVRFSRNGKWPFYSSCSFRLLFSLSELNMGSRQCCRCDVVVFDNADRKTNTSNVSELRLVYWIRAPTKCAMKCKNTIKFWLDKYLPRNVTANIPHAAIRNTAKQCLNSHVYEKKKYNRLYLSLPPLWCSELSIAIYIRRRHRYCLQLPLLSLSYIEGEGVRVYSNFAAFTIFGPELRIFDVLKYFQLA